MKPQCSNCEWFKPRQYVKEAGGNDGLCCLQPEVYQKDDDDFCSHFQDKQANTSEPKKEHPQDWSAQDTQDRNAAQIAADHNGLSGKQLHAAMFYFLAGCKHARQKPHQ